MVALTSLIFAAIQGRGSIKNDPVRQQVVVVDGSGRLRMTLDYHRGCSISSLEINGKSVGTASSGLQVDGKWMSSADSVLPATVKVDSWNLHVSGIQCGTSGATEDWGIQVLRDGISWSIWRKFERPIVVEQSAIPRLAFSNMQTWDGASLGTGGVARCKLFDAPNATLGANTRSHATFWNQHRDTGLDVWSAQQGPTSRMMRFTRQPSGEFTVDLQPEDHNLEYAHGQSRFLRNRQDVWKPISVTPADTPTVDFSITAWPTPRQDRGDFRGLSGTAIAQITKTIGRLGVVDEDIVGTNGWYSGYAVLHEPWIALMGLPLMDFSYTYSMMRTLAKDGREAVAADGMVKSRWAYTPGDEIPGTYDKNGFYECQWGRLMDAQTSFVINVAEQYDLERGGTHLINLEKSTCEAALQYLLRTDSDHNGLVKMPAGSRTQHKASDWLDTIWASYENAFVNAQLYRALTLWSRCEADLGDVVRAKAYAHCAALLKAQFNKPISQGGFWDPKNKWYVYWREKDGSVHGNNLVIPVNFMAIGYEVCDDPTRTRLILDRIEAEMVKQKLFCWPICMFPFTPDETSNQPFPNYENGDIFLAWAELGIRSYAKYRPDIAVKYVKSVLAQYEKDGLAFQRYSRTTQTGAGDDILANNASAVVGLYRNIYGIQPKANRLYLEPHLTPELYGTELNVGGNRRVLLQANRIEVRNGSTVVVGRDALGIKFRPRGLDYFDRDHDRPDLSIDANDISSSDYTSDADATDLPSAGASYVRDERSIPSLSFTALAWGATTAWTVQNSGTRKTLRYTIRQLQPGRSYAIRTSGRADRRVRATTRGQIIVTDVLPPKTSTTYRVRSAN